MLRVVSTVLWAQKAGNEPGEYEDAFHPIACGEFAGEELRFAVADGATEGMLSGRWAAMLCKLYRRRWLDLDTAPLWLDRAYNDWVRDKRDYLRRRAAANRPLQWYEEPGLAAGAFSTLLGLTLKQAEGEAEGAFEALALGDTCLFHLSEGELALQFPLGESSAFDDRPLLVSSNPARNRELPDRFMLAGGSLRRGDRFYLVTDALAAWFMRESEAGNAPWESLDALNEGKEDDSFRRWIAGLRESQQIRNDDVTCLRVCVL